MLVVVCFISLQLDPKNYDYINDLDSAWGCWGPGAGLCVQCRNFTRDGICAEYCPEEGF